jgi:hypothetical protein
MMAAGATWANDLDFMTEFLKARVSFVLRRNQMMRLCPGKKRAINGGEIIRIP